MKSVQNNRRFFHHCNQNAGDTVLLIPLRPGNSFIPGRRPKKLFDVFAEENGRFSIQRINPLFNLQTYNHNLNCGVIMFVTEEMRRLGIFASSCFNEFKGWI